MSCDAQVKLDLSLNLANAGFFDDALQMLRDVYAEPRSGAMPLVHYYRGYFCQQLGDSAATAKHFTDAANARPDFCFPARLHEILILQAAIKANPSDAHAPYLLGNLFYDRGRQADAIVQWESASKLNHSDSITWRNLGIAYFNHRHDSDAALKAYEQAWKCGSGDARLLFERDQLWKRLGVSPEKRLAELEAHPRLVASRDDLSVELCALFNLLGRHEEALRVLASRQFQPWEGGEGLAMSQYVQTHLALGKAALKNDDTHSARQHFEDALNSPANLGEARHILVNQSDIHYWLGVACRALDDAAAAQKHLLAAAESKGDFQEMSVRQYSEMTYFSAMAMRELGREYEATHLLTDLLAYAQQLAAAEAKVDYFATSLPAMLLFEDDLTARQQISAMIMETQASLGLGQRGEAERLVKEILERDPSHQFAAELLREMSTEKPSSKRPQPAVV
jgi:tetratricopeptide (TPR) repeat protein